MQPIFMKQLQPTRRARDLALQTGDPTVTLLVCIVSVVQNGPSSKVSS
jgi:hypothetical protein